jgi:hypothetical protein
MTERFERDDASDDFEEPLASAEAAASDAAWQDYLAGRDPGASLEEALREMRRRAQN